VTLLVLLWLIGQNERRLARAKELQLLANLEFLLGRAVLQLLDAFAPVVVLALHIRVFLFEPAYLLPLVHQRGNALGTPQRKVTIDSD